MRSIGLPQSSTLATLAQSQILDAATQRHSMRASAGLPPVPACGAFTAVPSSHPGRVPPR